MRTVLCHVQWFNDEFASNIRPMILEVLFQNGRPVGSDAVLDEFDGLFMLCENVDSDLKFVLEQGFCGRSQHKEDVVAEPLFNLVSSPCIPNFNIASQTT